MAQCYISAHLNAQPAVYACNIIDRCSTSPCMLKPPGCSEERKKRGKICQIALWLRRCAHGYTAFYSCSHALSISLLKKSFGECPQDSHDPHVFAQPFADKNGEVGFVLGGGAASQVLLSQGSFNCSKLSCSLVVAANESNIARHNLRHRLLSGCKFRIQKPLLLAALGT